MPGEPSGPAGAAPPDGPGPGLAGRLRWELEVLGTAVVFFTRLPLQVPYSPGRLSACSRYLPWVGLVVGGLGAGVAWAALRFWTPLVAVLLSTASTVLLTGAFHEDGFADVCDGLGGALEAERALAIMKDSRIGTYGALGLGLLLSLKVAALLALGPARLPAALVAGHASSRLAAALLIHRSRYARTDALSKAKPLSTRLSRGGLLVASLGGLLPLLAWPTLAPALLGPLAAHLLMKRWLEARLGGYTGDGLGATQQLAELFFYLLAAARCPA